MTESEIRTARALVEAGHDLPCDLARTLLDALPKPPVLRWPQPDADAEARTHVR